MIYKNTVWTVLSIEICIPRARLFLRKMPRLTATGCG